MSVSLERIKEVLKPIAFKDFSKWFGGQTGELRKGKLYVYEEDLISWFNKRPVTD